MLKPEGLPPLEVFALDARMNRISGTIPYTSLRWSRKYYSPGQFSMSVPSSIFDPEWRYVCTADRPETGIVNKVEYDDSSLTPDGIDTVTVSGFFLEHMLNDFTFLEEETEWITESRKKPTPVELRIPDFAFTDADGNLYTETIIWDHGEPTYHYRNVTTGDTPSKADVPAVEDRTYVELQPADTYNEIRYPTDNTDMYPDGYFTAGRYKTNYSYYTSNGDVHQIDIHGNDTVVSGVVGNVVNGTAIVEEDGVYKWLGGIVKNEGQTFYRQAESWERMSQQSNVTVSEDGQYLYYQVEVNGAWQLRTDIGEVGVPVDNVQTILLWLQRAFGNSLIYDTPRVVGVEKILDPSFKLMGDMAYEELATIEASIRLFYSFENNQTVLQIWQGLNRTQDDDWQPPAVSSAKKTGKVRALRAADPVYPLSESPYADMEMLPDGYERLEYIEGTGTQWIDTGFTPDQDTRVRARFVVTDARDANEGAGFIPYGCGIGFGNNAYEVYSATGKYEINYGNSVMFGQAVEVGDDVSIDQNKGTASISVNGGTATVLDAGAQTFEPPYAMAIMAIRRSSVIIGRGRAYYAEVYDDGQKVLDLAPCKRDSDGEVGLYDTVRGVFFGNAGSGDFVAGSAIPVCTLTYVANIDGATGSTASQKAFKGNSVAVAQNGFTVDGYSFLGWGTTSGSSPVAYQPGDAIQLNESMALYAQWSKDPVPDALNYVANAEGATGTMQPTSGSVGDAVIVAECSFVVPNGTFLGWNTQADGDGATYQPGEYYTLTDGNDVLYAQWFINDPTPVPGGKRAPFATFSDTWGSMYGFTASSDDSNYRNKCYVLREFDEPVWNDDGSVRVDHNAVIGGYAIPYTTTRDYVEVRLDDGKRDQETYVDRRADKPPADAMWPRETQEEEPDVSGVTKASYDAWKAQLEEDARAMLINDYGIVDNLDTGTLSQAQYISGWDLGDLVDMACETIGMRKAARIVGVEEVYDANGAELHIEIGNEKLSNYRKALLK